MVLELQPTLARKTFEPRDMRREHLLIHHLPYVSAVADDVLMLRDGDLMASFAVTGIGAATADPMAVEDLAAAMAAVVAQAAPDIAFYLHRVSTETAPHLPAPSIDNAFVREVDQRWQDHLERSGLRQRQTMVSVILRPSRIAGLWAKVVSGGKTQLRDRLERRIERLNETISYLMQTVSAAGPERLTASGGRWLGLFRAALTGTFVPVRPGVVITPIADLLATARVNFTGDTFAVFGMDSEETRYGAMLSIKTYPTTTHPWIFDSLDLSIDTVIAQSFTPADQIDALARVRRTARQMSAADDAAVSLQVELLEAADDLASGRISFGNHHGTVAVFARSQAALDEAITQVRRSGQESGTVLVREDIAARTAYFAQHPGNFAYRARAALISSKNFADFGALHGSPPGQPKTKAPWGDAITILPTVRTEPFRFNFHLPGGHDERTVGHTLVLGQTGSGKTLGTAFLAAQATRLNPRIIVFDKDQGLEMPVRAIGGRYEAVRMGVATGFNPFKAEVDERGTAWLTDWLSAILGGRHGELSAVQFEALANATKANALADPALQTLPHFRMQLRSVDDDGDLVRRLGRWDRDGQHGWVFAGSETDSLRMDGDVVGFDLTEIFDSDDVRTAWLSYVFRRIERMVEDERPTLIILDEAWKLLDDVYFERRLKDWMLTMRKMNVAVVLLTQRVSHIAESKAGGAIFESAVTTIIYPNSRNTPQEFEPLSLTDAEATFVTSSGSGHRMALIRSGSDSVVVDMDLSPLGPLLKVLGGGRGVFAPADWRDRPDFWKEIT